MIFFREACTLLKQLEAGINKDSAALEKYPLNRYIEFLKNYPQVCDYNFISPEVELHIAGILREYGPNILELYHKLLLVTLILEAVEKLPGKNIPPDIKNIYMDNFKRILSDATRPELNGDYLYSTDKFRKKLAICSFRLIPVGARKISQSKLPIKEFIFRKGVRQFVDILFYVLIELRGIMPLYIGHLDTNDSDLLAELNAEGLRRAYIRISELLKINKKIKGYFGTSWLLDPQLDHINQRHRYNREIVTRNGGKLYYKGPSCRARKNALQKSPTRRKLYAEGKYVPTDYVIIWSRTKLIQWAEKNPLLDVAVKAKN